MFHPASFFALSLQDEFGFEPDGETRKELTNMCNLSEGLTECAEARGIVRATQNIIRNFLAEKQLNCFPIEVCAMGYAGEHRKAFACADVFLLAGESSARTTAPSETCSVCWSRCLQQIHSGIARKGDAAV